MLFICKQRPLYYDGNNLMLSLFEKMKNLLWENMFNPLTPDNPYSGCTAPLTSKPCILYIYSTNIGTEYFKHGIYSPFQNAVHFIILTYLVPVLFTFCIQGVLKLKKNSDAKRLKVFPLTHIYLSLVME